MIPFPQFAPDAGELESSTLNNVFVTRDGYGPRPTLTAASGATVFSSGSQVRGAFAGQVPGGAFNGFLCDGTKVWALTSTFGYSDLGVTFTVPTGEDESFSQYGVFMFGTNTTDGLYAYNMSSPSGFNAVSGSPKARVVFQTNNCLILLWDTTSNPTRMTNTALGDYTNFTTQGANKIDFNDGAALTGGGDLGGPYAVILQQRAVRLLTFGQAGGGALFAIAKIATDIGCVHPRAFAIVNGTCYFLDTKGFFSVNPSAGVVNIGAKRVNQWFLNRCPDLTKVYASVDPANTIVRFRYKSTNCASEIVYNDILDYNYVEDRFIPGTENTTWIFRMATPGYTLTTLDALGAVSGAWGSLAVNSSFFTGGNDPSEAGLDSTGKFGFFNGTNAAATLETNTQTRIGTVAGVSPFTPDGLSVLTTSVEPLSDDPNMTVQMLVKDALNANAVPTTATPLEPSGRAKVRGRGKLWRVRHNHPAGSTWNRDQGVGTVVQQSGGPR